MRTIASLAMILLTMTAAAAHAQSNGANQGLPMSGGAPQPDTSRVQQEMAQAQPPRPAEPLKITFGGKVADWTAATLVSLPHVTLTVHNEHAKKDETYSGVPLIELLTRLGVPEKPHGRDFRLYLVAEGSDGYQVVYSVAEATPDVHDGTVIVADAQDGRPIGNDGPLKLVATGEKRPAR
ncbi:MAG TPA: hypothetical protein VLZ50_06470, partial [Terracidiphilus sp.]|nr:hypothetical protein [Terracidiphilus sp.]